MERSDVATHTAPRANVAKPHVNGHPCGPIAFTDDYKVNGTNTRLALENLRSSPAGRGLSGSTKDLSPPQHFSRPRTARSARMAQGRRFGQRSAGAPNLQGLRRHGLHCGAMVASWRGQLFCSSAEDREEVCAPAQIVFVINNERIAACDKVF